MFIATDSKTRTHLSVASNTKALFWLPIQPELFPGRDFVLQTNLWVVTSEKVGPPAEGMKLVRRCWPPFPVSALRGSAAITPTPLRTNSTRICSPLLETSRERAVRPVEEVELSERKGGGCDVTVDQHVEEMELLSSWIPVGLGAIRRDFRTSLLLDLILAKGI